MSDGTAQAIAFGVGPLIAALIAAYQLWLKPKVDESRELPFDLDRLRRVERDVRRIRLQLILFTLLVAALVVIPVGGTVESILEIDFEAPFSLAKVLVAFVATVGVIHFVFLVGRFQAVSRELDAISARIAQRQPGPDR